MMRFFWIFPPLSSEISYFDPADDEMKFEVKNRCFLRLTVERRCWYSIKFDTDEINSFKKSRYSKIGFTRKISCLSSHKMEEDKLLQMLKYFRRTKNFKQEREVSFFLAKLQASLQSIKKTLNPERIELCFKRFFVLDPDFVNSFHSCLQNFSQLRSLRISFTNMPQNSFQIFDKSFFGKNRLNIRLKKLNIEFLETLQVQKQCLPSQYILEFIQKILPQSIIIRIKSSAIPETFAYKLTEILGLNSSLKTLQLELQNFQNVLGSVELIKILQSIEGVLQLNSLSISQLIEKCQIRQKYLEQIFSEVMSFFVRHTVLKKFDFIISPSEISNKDRFIQNLNWMDRITELVCRIYQKEDCFIIENIHEIPCLEILKVNDNFKETNYSSFPSSIKRLKNLKKLKIRSSNFCEEKMICDILESISKLKNVTSIIFTKSSSIAQTSFEVSTQFLEAISGILEKNLKLHRFILTYIVNLNGFVESQKELLRSILNSISHVNRLELPQIISLSALKKDKEFGFLISEIRRKIYKYGSKIKVCEYIQSPHFFYCLHNQSHYHLPILNSHIFNSLFTQVKK